MPLSALVEYISQGFENLKSYALISNLILKFCITNSLRYIIHFPKISIRSLVTKADAAFCAPTESTETVLTPLIDRWRSITAVLNGTRMGFEGKTASTKGENSSSLACGGVTGRKCGKFSRTQASSLFTNSFEAIRSRMKRPPRPTRRLTRPRNRGRGFDREA